MLNIAYNKDKAIQFIDKVKGKKPLFSLVISYTETSEIDGITIAGANKDLIKYTPAADAEFIHYGYCKCINTIPATPDGKPTPALLTRAALNSINIPMLVIDAGSKIKPNIPYINLDASYAKRIDKEDAMNINMVERIYYNSIELGKTLAKLNDFIIIGESIPGGTTTALALLLALGIDARFKVSSSMPNNPHNIKNYVVSNALRRANLSIGSLKDKPLEAVSILGDPMMITIAGISIGAKDSNIILSGGTQMSAILALIKSLDASALEDIVIGTTRYIVEDKSSNIIELVKEIYPIPILYVDPMLDKSSIEGLRAYANGFVKEGAGAGGSCIGAMLNGINDLLPRIEDEYKRCIIVH